MLNDTQYTKNPCKAQSDILLMDHDYKDESLTTAAESTTTSFTHDFNPSNKANQNTTPPEVEQVEEDTTPLLDLATGQDDLDQTDIRKVLATTAKKSCFPASC